MSSKNIKLSFVIPVYNAELYLNKCIDSILISNSQEIEIVIVDDGSTDKSVQISDEYAKNNEIVKVIHQKNSGVAHARNIGIKESSGDYIFFVDNDDWVDGKELINLINILKTTNTDLLINRYLIIDNRKQSLGNGFINKNNIDNKSTEYVLNYFRKNRINIMAPWEYVVKKEIITKNNLSFNTNQNGADDSVFSPILFCNCNSFYLNENVIYFWRFRQDSQGKTQDRHSYILKMVSTIDSLNDYLKNIQEKSKIDYLYFSIYKNVYSLLGQYNKYSDTDKIFLYKWYVLNKDLIKKSVRRSGAFHFILSTIFGLFGGIMLSYRLATLKGKAYLNFYKNKK